ncbi:unnamed protein product, partial [Hapterophycus canaliculatus]
MTKVHHPQQRPRAPRCNKLHRAVRAGSAESVAAIVASRCVDIDEVDEKTCTPLMRAAQKGHCPIVGILLKEGADVSVAGPDGLTALLIAAHLGNLGVTKMLIEAGAGLEVGSLKDGRTALVVAARAGHLEVTRALIDAGANPDADTQDGLTALYVAAREGHPGIVRVLLCAKANPLLGGRIPSSGITIVPLERAVLRGHTDVVRELVRQVKIAGCGGQSGGMNALRAAVSARHVDIVDILTEAGVVDSVGGALTAAIKSGCIESVRLLLQRQPKNGKGADAIAYVDRPMMGIWITPLIYAIVCHQPRALRLLLDAGADACSPVRITDREGVEVGNLTPIEFARERLREELHRIRGLRGEEYMLSAKEFEGKQARLNAIVRLLLQHDAVHAISWSWP